jgi:predicted metal-dependent HD superfamily phosphohydrolase
MNYFNKIPLLIEDLFQKSETSLLIYHTFSHTHEVSAKVLDAARALNLETAELLFVAGLFHDTGYLFGYQKHEEKSMELAEHYLKKIQIPFEEINFVNECIAATELGVSPSQEAAALLKDCDLSYGITDKFFERGPQLRKEWELNLDKFYSDEDWEKLQFDFLEHVLFSSNYAKTHFMPIVEANKILQRKRILPV